MRKNIKAQSILEYAILIAVVSAALISMSLYVKRAVQANLKTVEHQINAEANTSY
jgi:Flp pilus assembly pilin Flp